LCDSCLVQDTNAAGVLGRLLSTLDAQLPSKDEMPYKTAAYSLDGNAKILEGWRPPLILDPRSGVVRLAQHEGMAHRMAKLIPNVSASIFGPREGSCSNLAPQTHQRPMCAAHTRAQPPFCASSHVQRKLDGFHLNHTFPSGDNTLGPMFEQVARVIRARKQLGAERDVFFVQLRRFDTHSSVHSTLDTLFGWVDDAMKAFVTELRDQGVWDSVVVQALSEFGRTLTSNGMGTDHGWGGNTWTAGGAVAGGRIHGQFPASLSVDGDHSVGRSGRLIPTTPWEGLWRPLAEWFGVDTAMIHHVLPNIDNFDDQHIVQKEDLLSTR
jgi:hypothetical protein